MREKRPLTARKRQRILWFRFAQPLVDWLNSKTPNELGHRERIGRVIEKLNALRPPQKRFRKARGEREKVGVPQGAEYGAFPGDSSFHIVFKAPEAERWISELRQLNQSIKDCLAHPRFGLPIGDGWTVGWQADSDFGKHLGRVVSSAGVISRVRRCANCTKWFLAARRNQLCCTERCRKDKYAKSPEGKARTAKRMKKYMRKVRQEKRKTKR